MNESTVCGDHIVDQGENCTVDNENNKLSNTSKSLSVHPMYSINV
jgi:hypothetical protein